MTITTKDVYSKLGPQSEYPPIPEQFIDHVVRVLNAHRGSAFTVQGPADLDAPSARQDTAASHPPLPRRTVHPNPAPRASNHPTDQGNPT